MSKKRLKRQLGVSEFRKSLMLWVPPQRKKVRSLRQLRLIQSGQPTFNSVTSLDLELVAFKGHPLIGKQLPKLGRKPLVLLTRPLPLRQLARPNQTSTPRHQLGECRKARTRSNQICGQALGHALKGLLPGYPEPSHPFEMYGDHQTTTGDLAMGPLTLNLSVFLAQPLTHRNLVKGPHQSRHPASLLGHRHRTKLLSHRRQLVHGHDSINQQPLRTDGYLLFMTAIRRSMLLGSLNDWTVIVNLQNMD